MIDPQVAGLLESMKASGQPPFHTMTPTNARAWYRATFLALQNDPVEVRGTVDHQIPITGGTVRLREYQPPLRPATPAGPLPCLLYIHGGGFVLGDVDTYDPLCRSLCVDAQCAVVSVDYRLAPEHPYPAALDDCVAAFRWVVEHADDLNIDPRRIAVGGDSGGGLLSAVVCLVLRGEAFSPVFQLLIYPAADLKNELPSRAIFGEGYLLDKYAIDWFLDHTFPDPQVKEDWKASPLLAPSHENLPPALVITAGFDPLFDEGRAYADALSKAGVPTEYVSFSRQIHGFIGLGRVVRETQTAIDLCTLRLRRAFQAC